MKAVQFSETGGTDVLKLVDVPRPTPEPSEVLIRVEYAGVNFIDTYLRSGLYPTQLPCISGREAAGIVEELGTKVPPEFGLEVGDKVAVFSPGAMAEYMVADAKAVLKLPPRISTKQGAAIMLQGLTAWTLCRDAHELKRDEIALVQAAAGGTGGLLVQMAKSLGATVIGTTSSAAKAAVAKSQGCDHVIIYTEQDVQEEVLKLTDGKGCHVVYSGIGKDTVEMDMALTRRKGTFVTFGNSSGAIASIKPLDLSKKNIKLVRPTLGNYITERDEFVTRSSELLELVEKDIVKVNLGAEYSLAEVGKAQEDLVSKRTVGKLIVKI